jgi:uncharacterized protein
MNIIQKKIAIIGSGISGLGAAYLLNSVHNITVYDKSDYIGGHSRTIEIENKDGKIPVDTGFIVFNQKNYPLLTSLFKHLDVPIIESNMSFGVSINDGQIEYGTQKLRNVFTQKINLLKPGFWRMIYDIIQFNNNARQFLHSEPNLTLGECLQLLKMGPWFKHYYLLAMGGAIWSTPIEEMLKFPAATFIRFFDNHGLLTTNDQPQWYTVVGGSREYIKRLTKNFKNKIHTNRGVIKVVRNTEDVIVVDTTGQTETYDEVVFACHADQALSIIEKPNPNEIKILNAFKYQKNRVVLHTDQSFMPIRKNAWSSWVYVSKNVNDEKNPVSLSYWMNNLQPLMTDEEIFVTLNPGKNPDPILIKNDHVFEHPLFDEDAIGAQTKIDIIQGKNKFWFCGAYQRYGFHEDGLQSAVNMASAMGINRPWT